MKGEESSSKAEQGSKTKEAEHLISRCQNFAHLISRCENFAHPKTKVRNPWAKGSHFRTPQKVRNHSRCEIRFQGANFLKSNFAHHCGRCENFRTVRNPLLAHVCQFRTPQAIFALCETVCENFAHTISRCENFAHLLRCEIFIERVPFSHTQFQGAKFADQGAKISHARLKQSPAHKLRTSGIPNTHSLISAMAKTRGGLSASPSSPTPRPHEPPWEPQLPPVQAPAIPPSEGEAPSQRRYPTRRPPTDPVPPVDQATSPVSRPQRRDQFSGPGEPSHAPQPEPATEEPRIPADMPPRPLSGVP
ncbi:hypothetical protein CK203_047331 [Vitis vinifera]|uniref:Uncharacterized protein n=1 Tax=Vitis vinifera TaxID=29760 RepID=A0A438HHP7_VITVI|nr:hypothetical protein CK203_047331 [Vitis vinifera]